MANNKSLLIVSSSGGKNFKLANSLKELVESAYPITTKIIEKIPFKEKDLSSSN